MMLFYMTPVLYPMSFIPDRLSFIFNLNPMAHIVNAYRDILYYKVGPDLGSIGIVALISAAVLLIGYAIFRKLEKGFAEEL